MEKFFIIVPPDFEAVTLQELKEVWNDLLPAPQEQEKPELALYTAEKTHGGINLEASLFRAVQLNYFLKTATRILWRTDEFKADDFKKLAQKAKSSRLRTLIGTGSFDFKITSEKSKIYNESKILEIMLQELDCKYSDQVSDRTVFVRTIENNFTISLDLSGDFLFRRGWATNKETAPIRETWAALFLHLMLKDIPLAELNESILLDPFAGSGTLLWESSLLHIPNFHRKYAFPAMNGTPKLFKGEFKHNYKKIFQSVFKNLIGLDISEKAVTTMKLNFDSIKDVFKNEKLVKHKTSKFQFKKMDSFRVADIKHMLDDEEFKAQSLYIFSNPPYGERLNEVEINRWIPEVLKTLKPRMMGLVLSQDQFKALEKKPTKHWAFSNGGLKCVFCVYKPM